MRTHCKGEIEKFGRKGDDVSCYYYWLYVRRAGPRVRNANTPCINRLLSRGNQ